MLLNQAGKSLDLGPSISNGPQGFHLAKEETDEDVIKYYEEDPTQGIDLSRPDAEEHWNAIKRGYSKRTTDYAQLIADAGGEIAAIPGQLIEGVAEDGLVKGVASTAEGVVRSLRDLWGMATESENPDSVVFGFNSVLKALMHGKPSQNWMEEARQWNQARKFNYHTMRMMQGDESVLEQYIDMDEDTAKKVRSFINPKVAHAMSFIGMELPSIIAAPFTGGASAELAVAAAGQRAIQSAALANKANLYSRIGNTLASATQRFDNFAQKVTQRAAGGVLSGLGKALEIPANIAGAAVGGTIDNLASRTGFSSGYLRNAAETATTDAAVALGGVAGGTRQTVGYLGSMGLRTTSELLQEIGNKATMRSFGVVEAGVPTSLTVLESVAANPLLSPSAKVAAKMLNTVVDPVLQLSTASLKHAYKDALTFSFLGYLSDKERGAIGGAAQGMMWGGYSGALRHGWSMVNGGMSHDIHIKNFDENYLPQVEKINPKFASLVREVSSFADATKSTRVMSQVRSVAQILWSSLDSADKKNIITHVGDRASLESLLLSEGIDPSQLAKFSGSDYAGGSFTLAKGKNGMVPVLFLNRQKHKFQDFGHEVLGHVLSYTLREKGKLGEHLRRYFGDKADGGIFSDEIIASRAARRRSLEIAVVDISARLSKDDPSFVTEVNKRAKEIYEGTNTSRDGSKAFYLQELKELRDRANFGGAAAFWLHTMPDSEGKQTPAAYAVGQFDSIKFMFEEGIAGYAESLFIHTNLQNLILPDELKPFRVNLERIYNERFARKVTDLEMAGIRAKHGEFMVDSPGSNDHGKLTIQAEAYDDGVWRRAPEYDQLIQSMVRDATSHDAQAINRLSPAQQLAEAKLHRKEFLFNIGRAGATMKGTKELNDMSTKAATDAFEVFKNLDESIRPDIILDEHGNQSVDMMRIKDEALGAMEAAGAIDPETARAVKVVRDAYTRWESTGFATSNIFTGTYWGDSQRTIKNGFFQRLFGNDVSVTHRVFAPFEMKLTLKTTDGAGKQLRTPRGGMLMTVVDYMAIHRRKMKLWSRPDVRNTFVSLDTYNKAFDEYLINMMKDAGSRVPSAELFNKRFPGQGDKVRDILYETFGGSIRKDESYINAPREGYSSSHENPNYPIHSMRMELLVGLELTSGKPLPYHHGRSYEGLRRNYSLAGFERVNMSDNRLVNGQGYEIVKTGVKWKVFSPFGGIVGMFSDFSKASKAVDKDLSKRDLADLMPKPTEIEWADMTKSQRLQYMSEVGRITHQTYSQRMLEGKGRASLSLASFDPDSDAVFVADYADKSYAFLKKLFNVSGGNYVWKALSGPGRGSLKEWNLSNKTEGFDPGQIRIIPVEGDEDRAFGPLHKHTGLFYTTQHQSLKPEQGDYRGVAVQIDFDAIEAFTADDESRARIVQSAIEESIEKFSAFHSPHGALIALAYKTLNIVRAGEPVDGYVHQANAIRFKQKSPEFSALRDAEISKMKNDLVNAFGKPGGFQNTAPTGDGLRKLLLESSAASFEAKIKSGEHGLNNDELRIASRLVQLRTSKNNFWFKSNFAVIAKGIVSVNDILKEMAYGDKENWIDVPDERGGFQFAYSFSKKEDAKNIDAALRALNTALNSDRTLDTGPVMHGFMNELFVKPLHALLQVVDKTMKAHDLSVYEKELGRTGYVISAEYTLEQLSSSLEKPVYIFGRDGRMTLVSASGFIATTAKKGELIDRAGVEGKSEIIPKGAQPAGAMRNTEYLSPFSALVRYKLEADSNKLLPKDVEALTHFGILEIAAIGMNPELEESFRQHRAIFASSKMDVKDRLRLSESMLRDVVQSGDKSLIGLAMAVHAIEKAREPSGRIEALGRIPANVDDAMLSMRFMDEALTNWTLQMQRFWALGNKFEEGLDSIMGRKYYAEFGMNAEQTKKAQSVVKRIRQYHKAPEKFFEQQRGSSKPMLSLADASGLTKEQKDELGKLGMLKRVTIKGVETDIVELSDRDSFVDYSASNGEPHMLPFAFGADPQKAFSDYQQEVQRRFTTPGLEVFIPRDQILGKTTLGKVFGHPLLYKYYPWLKDIEVNFLDMHGAQAGKKSDGSYLINIGARALAYEKLALPPEADKFRVDNESLTSRYSGSNYITGLFVHEIQHILQRAGNILEEHRSIQGVDTGAVRMAFGKLLGIQIEPQIGYFDMKYGMADQKIIENFVNHPDAPVIASLRLHAKPLMKTATRNMMEFATFEHTAGRMSDELFRKAQSLHVATSNIDTIDDAYRAYKQFTQLREDVADANPRFIPVMCENKDFRVAIGAMGLISHYNDVIKGAPDGRKVALAKAFREYSNMEYVLEPVERQAFTSQQRRGLTQSELAIKDRALAENSSVLELVDAAMNTSGIRARELGGTTLMNSIAGIDADASDSPAATALGFMSVVRFFMGKAHRELEELGRFVVSQQGWEIDDGGRLVLTTGRYVVKGDFEKAKEALVKKNREQYGKAANYGDSNAQFLGLPESVGSTGKPRTYTIKEFAELANFVIESEDVLSVGNSVIDIINSDRFPPMVLGGEIRSELMKYGVFTEQAARAVMLDSIDTKMKDMVLTKNDLLNLLTFNHVVLNTSAVTSGIGGVPDMRNRTVSAADVRKLAVVSDNDNAFDSALYAGMGELHPAQAVAKEMELGSFKWTANKLTFRLSRPSWCPEDAWSEFKKRFDASKFVASVPKIVVGTEAVGLLNQRMRRAALLIGPVVKAAAEKIEKMVEEDRGLSRRLYATLLADLEANTLRIAVGSDMSPIGVKDDTLAGAGMLFDYNAGSPSTIVSRYGFKASNDSVFGQRGGQRQISNTGFIPTMLGTMFGPYIHHMSESPALATADVAERVRPGSNITPEMANSAIAEGTDNLQQSASYYDPRSVMQEEALVYANKFSRDGSFSDIKRAFSSAIDDVNSNARLLEGVSKDIEYAMNEPDITEAALEDLGEYLSEVSDDRYGGRNIDDVRAMNLTERQALLAPILEDVKARKSNMDAQSALMTKVYDVWEDALMAADAADKSVISKRVSGVWNTNIEDVLSTDKQKVRGLSLTGVFGMVAPDGKAIINLDTDNADITGISSFPIHTAGRGIPLEAITHYNRTFLNLETAVSHGLFSMLRPKTLKFAAAHANPEAFKAGIEASIGGYERAEVLIEYIEKYAKSEKSVAVSLNDGPMAYYLGGNVLAVQSVMGLLMLENPDKGNQEGANAFLQSQLGRIMSLLGEENRQMAQPVISSNKATIYNSGTAVQVTHATLGAVALPLLWPKLKTGIPTVSKEGKVLLSGYGFFNDMIQAVNETIQRGGSKEEIALVAKDWIAGIDKEGIPMIAHELSSQMSASAVMTMLGLIAGVDFSKRNQLPANFGYSMKGALNFGAAFGLDHKMAQHSALSGKVDNIGPGALASTLAKLMESAMTDESGEFWIGMAVSMQAMRDKRSKSYPLVYTGRYSSRPYQARNRIRADVTLLSDTEFPELYVPTFAVRAPTFRHDPSMTPGISNPAWEGVMAYADNDYGPSPAYKYKPSDKRLEWTMFGVDDTIEMAEARSPELMQDVIESTTTMDAIGQAQWASFEGMTGIGMYGVNDDGTTTLKASDGTGRSYTEIDYVVGSESGGAVNVPSLGTVVKSAINRSLVTNRIAAVAKQLGKSEVSTPAARFNLTVAPAPLMMAIKAADERRAAWMSRQAYISKVMGRAGSTGGQIQYHAKDYGKIGVSWKRLEDGRILVNFSPDIAMTATYDILHDSDIQSPAVGIPLLRAVGWDPNTQTAFSQSLARRSVFGLGKALGSYTKEQGIFLNNGKKYGAIDDVAVREYLRGMHKLLNSDIYLGGKTQNKILGNASLRSRMVRELNSTTRRNLELLVTGQIPSTPEEMLKLSAYADEAMHDISQDFAYFSIVLPADAKIEDFNTAVLNHYASAMHPSGAYVKTRGAPVQFGIDGPTLSTHIERLSLYPDEMRSHLALLNAMREGMDKESAGSNPTLQLKGMEAGIAGASGANLPSLMDLAAKSIQSINPNFHGDMTAAFHRILSGESGYFLPDSERSLAMYGERSAAIEIMFPGRTDLKHHSWDTSESLNLTVFKNAQKRWTIGWNEFGPIGPDGKKQVRRMVRNFDTESEATALADKISAGNIQAEVAKTTPNRDSLRMESAGNAKGMSASVIQSTRLTLDNGPQGELGNVVWGGGKKWGVGNSGKLFDTQEAAKAAANLLRQGDVLTMEAPKQERINLSLADHSQNNLEQILRQRPIFAIGGTPIQFVSNMVNVLIRNADKHKRVRDVRTGLEWFELMVDNRVTKNELRATGIAEFLYANRKNNITKKELFDYLYVFYPQQGRKVWQSRYDKFTPDAQKIRNPHNIDFVASRMLYASRTLKLVQNIFNSLDRAILEANDDGKASMEVAAQAVKDMHLAALVEAYEKVMNKDVIRQIITELDLEGSMHDGRKVVTTILDHLQRTPERILQYSAPLLETYRLNLNTAVAKAKLESLSALSGIELQIGDPFMMDSTQLTQSGLALSDWDTAVGEYYDMEQNTMQQGYGFYKGPDAGYAGYTSGLGEHVYTALYTEVIPREEQYNQYIANLEKAQAAATDPVEKAKYSSMIDSARHVYAVRRAISDQFARNAGSHRGAPSGMGMNLIGHLRVTDATVPTAIPVLSTPGTIFEQLKSYGAERGEDAQIPVSFIEELQSDTYQRRTFGPQDTEYQLYATFKEIEEIPGIRKQLTEVTDKLTAERMSDNMKASYIMNHHGGPSARYVIARFLSGAYASHQIRNAGPFMRYMLSQISNFGWKPSGKLIPVPKALQENYGLPASIPDVHYQGTPHTDLRNKYRQTTSHPIESMNVDVLQDFIFPGNNETIPGFGNIRFRHLVQHGSSERGFTGLAKFFLAMSPEFVGIARELSAAALKDPAAVETFKGKIDFDAIASEWALKLGRIATSQDLRKAFIEKYGDSPTASMHFNRMVQLANIMADIVKIEADESAFQVRNVKFSDNQSHNQHRALDIDPDSSSFDVRSLDRKVTFAVAADDNIQRFVKNIASKIGVEREINLYELYDKYSLNGDFAVKSPRGMLATTISFTAEALGVPEIKVAEAMLIDDPVNSSVGLKPEDILSFAKPRMSEKLSPNRKVVAWLNEMTSSDDTRHKFARRIGFIFRSTDYEGDSQSSYIHQMYDHIQHNAKTMLGKTMEAMAAPMAILWASVNKDDKSAQLMAQQADLAKKAGLKLDSDGNLITADLADSLPHGEDNAYRPIMVNAYVMNALAKRQRALVIADARHHRARYSSIGYVNHAVNLGNGKIFMLNNAETDLSAAAYVLEVVRKRGMFNKLIDRIREQNLDLDDRQIEIDGTGKTLGSWLIEAGHQVIDQFPEAFAEGATRDQEKREFARSIEFMTRIRKRQGGSGDMQASFNNVNDSADMIKRMEKMKNAPEGLIVSLPYDKTHGYTVNYGAPGWQNEYYYAGNPQKVIESVSHDAFEKASIAMANDKTYVVLAPNGKVLFEKISTLAEAEERAAQSSKYLGNVPHLTVFLKQYGRIGAYVMEAFMQASASGERNPSMRVIKEGNRNPAAIASAENLMGGAGLAGFTKTDWNAGKYDESYLGPYSMDDAPASHLADGAALLAKDRGRHASPDALGPSYIPSAGNNSRAPIPLQLHAMGITKMSSNDEVAAGMVRLGGFTGPMLVIKPKFPTAMQATEMAKLIVEGVSLMSLSDMSNEGKAKAASAALTGWIGDKPELLSKVMAQVASWKPQRKTSGVEQLREAVKYSLTSKEPFTEIAKKFGVERSTLQTFVAKLKKSGINIPDRPPGSEMWDKVEMMSKNSKTGLLGLSQEIKDSIRLMSSGGASQREIAQHLGISQATVWRVVNGIVRRGGDYRPERADPTEPYGGPHA